MSAETLIILALAIPGAVALLLPLFGARPNIREAVTLFGAAMLAAVILSMLGDVFNGARPRIELLAVAPGLTIEFAVEPLGMLFATVASILWIANSIYSIGYMRAERAHRQTLFYFCFAVAIASTMGIALAGNLFTLFLFYELLTISTYPLVTHTGTEQARKAGRTYLLLLLGASTILLLPAIAWTMIAADTLSFADGGILEGKLTAAAMGFLLALYVFGIAKAAVMPVHFWLPAAMVAPTPVSALLHAVAVVKAGVFTILKVVVYVFGIDTLAEAGASEWLIYVAGATVVLASVIALRQDNLKRRLAYSTVSQLSYVVMGAALATSAGIMGGAMQIAMHAAGKITLFFCAGAILVVTHKTEISTMRGIGRQMPITMTAFLIGSLSIIGLPPLGGAWSKWWLLLGAADHHSYFAMGVLIISTLLNVAYLLPIVIHAFFVSEPETQPSAPSTGGFLSGEAPLACLIPLSLTALLCFALFFGVGPLETLLGGMLEPPGPVTGDVPHG